MSTKSINTIWQTIKVIINKLITSKFWKLIPFMALFFIGGMVWYNWRLLPDNNWTWQNLLWLIVAFIFYPISLLLLFVNWNDIMHKLGASIEMAPNLYIFCMNVINRRLPMGMFWSAGGRVNAYKEKGVSIHIIAASLAIEFFFHGFSALLLWMILEIFGYGYIRLLLMYVHKNIIYLVSIVIILSIVGLMFVKYRDPLQKKTLIGDTNIFYSSKWLLLYGVTWVNAGLMLFFVIKSITGSWIPFGQVIATWALIGVIGYMFSIIPFMDVGSKEISLTFLLSQFMPFVQSLLIAIIFRLLLTISDAVWPILVVVGLKLYDRYLKHTTVVYF